MTTTETSQLDSTPENSSEPKPSRRRRGEPWLFEIAWEVCNQVGGIYTVIRSKTPAMVNHWGNRYFLVGPYNHATASVEFEPRALSGSVGQAVKQMRDLGLNVHYGRWLVTGRPNVVLLDHTSVFNRLHEIKYRMWNDHNIPMPDDELINNTAAFGEMVRIFMNILAHKESPRRHLVAHFHEWMAGGLTIPMLRKEAFPGALLFTTHATNLGRYLAMNDEGFYHHLHAFDALAEAKNYNIETQHRLESAAAHGCHVFTTVSDVTAEECKHLLGRQPDILLPNGLNIQRFSAIHEFQNLHRQNKQKIHQFTMGHFFPSYTFDLDKTVYFFTSGRYEYRNKGMDLTIEALARLNHRLRVAGSDRTVINFIITRRPTKSINVSTLETNAMLDELKTTADAFKDQIGEKVFLAAAEGRIPDLNALVDEYWRLRLRRTIHAWKRESLPPIVTHDLIDDQKDEVLNQMRAAQLWNSPHDPVKMIYHPEFITPANPLFGMDYDQFVRGCHLGIFPSYYEPWGYTPLESIALGVPAVTSDLSGFGSYLLQLLPDHEERGLYVIERRFRSFDQAADQLADLMFQFVQLSRRERISLRNNVESFSEYFDWHNLGQRYHEAHQLALDRLG